MQIVFANRKMQEVSKLLRKFDKTDKKQEIEFDAEIAHKIKIVKFGLKHGYKLAVEAFGIKKSVYYKYAKQYKESTNIRQLKPKSKKPVRIRKSCWDKVIVRFIRNIRYEHPNIGKDKIKYYLDKFCLDQKIKTVSTGTIRNIINSFSNKLRTKTIIKSTKKRTSVLRKPKGYKAVLSGECTALDSMEFRSYGYKRYILVASDEATGLLYAEATTSHTSRSAKNILLNAFDYLPYEKFNIILTDNGSEFAKDFDKYVKENNITHYHTYPKSPKQNARCERVNRTIQEEFMIQHESLLFHDLAQFNRKLKSYLHWFNFKRVHARFDNKITPFEKHCQLQTKSGENYATI